MSEPLTDLLGPPSLGPPGVQLRRSACVSYQEVELGTRALVASEEDQEYLRERVMICRIAGASRGGARKLGSPHSRRRRVATTTSAGFRVEVVAAFRRIGCNAWKPSGSKAARQIGPRPIQAGHVKQPNLPNFPTHRFEETLEPGGRGQPSACQAWWCAATVLTTGCFSISLGNKPN